MNKIHFSVGGAGFTELARNMMLSECPDQAWRLIANGLVGKGSETVARGVLDGTLKLVNANDGELTATEDNDCKRYLKTLRYIYAGRIRMDGTWWRPVATIERFSPESAAWASKEIPADLDNPLQILRSWSDRRASFFCTARERTIFFRTEKCYVVFEPCGERPFWWEPVTTPQDALVEAKEAGRRLDIRGEGPTTQEIIQTIEEEEDPDLCEGVRELAEEAEWLVRTTDHEAALNEIAEQVREQAGTDTFVLVVPADTRTKSAFGLPRDPRPERHIAVPRPPFWNWALARTKLKHLAPPWKTVSPTGIKLQFDDPNHSDWMLGAGLDLKEDYGTDDPVSQAAYNEMFRLQEMLGAYEVTVIVDNGPVFGTVGKEIAVLPDLSPDHAKVAMRSRALIAEKGGALAHLSVVGRKIGLTVIRDPNALHKYPAGTVLLIDPESGTVKRHET